jgi:hypothetical protein
VAEVEIGEEINIDFVKKANGWESIKYELEQRFNHNGLNVVRYGLMQTMVLKWNIFDPELLDIARKKSFSDVYYYFYVQTLTINDLKRGSKFLDKDLRDIAAKYGNQNKVYIDFDSATLEIFWQIDVMRYAYKSQKITSEALAKTRTARYLKVASGKTKEIQNSKVCRF